MTFSPSSALGAIENLQRRRGRSCHSAAFSLLELLIVLAILLILSSMYFGFASRGNQQNQKKNCRDNLQKVFVAMEIYANEHAGKFPDTLNAKTSGEALAVLVPRYTADTRTFTCPGSKDAPLSDGVPFAQQKISYAYYMGRARANASDVLMSDKQVDNLSKSAGQQVFSADGKPPGNNHHQFGGNFLFCDGHAESGPATAPFSLVFTQGVVLLNP